MYGKITAYGTNCGTRRRSVTIREPDFGWVGTSPSSGAKGYQWKLAGCPWKLPALTLFRLHEQFHGPWLSM